MFKQVEGPAEIFAVAAEHPAAGKYFLYAAHADNLLFTENEAKFARLNYLILLKISLELSKEDPVYLLPVLGLFVGAFSLNYLSSLIGLNPTWGMALFTIAGVVAAVVLMRFLANRMAQQESLTPIVKRIVRPAFEPINLN